MSPRSSRTPSAAASQGGALPHVSHTGLDCVRRAVRSALDEVPVVALEGEVGAGKTTLLHALERFAPIGTRTCFVPFVNVGPGEMERWILGLHGPADEGAGLAPLLDAPRVWLLVDEAQSVPPESAARLGERIAEAAPRLRLVLAGVPGPAFDAVQAATGQPVRRIRIEEGLTTGEIARLVRAAGVRSERAIAPYAERLRFTTAGVPGRVVRALEREMLAGGGGDAARGARAGRRDPAEQAGSDETRRRDAAAAAAPAPETPAATPGTAWEAASAPPTRPSPGHALSGLRPVPPAPAPPPAAGGPGRSPRARRRFAAPAALVAAGLAAGLALLCVQRVPEPAPLRDAGELGAQATPPGDPAAAAETVRVHINVRPYGRVFVDGRELGTTPLASVPLEPGTREIVAKLPDGSVLRRQVEVRPDTRFIALP